MKSGRETLVGVSRHLLGIQKRSMPTFPRFPPPSIEIFCPPRLGTSYFLFLPILARPSHSLVPFYFSFLFSGTSRISAVSLEPPASRTIHSIVSYSYFARRPYTVDTFLPRWKRAFTSFCFFFSVLYMLRRLKTNQSFDVTAKQAETFSPQNLENPKHASISVL